LVDLVSADDIPVAVGFSTALDEFVQAAADAPAVVGPKEIQELIALGLAARRPLLELLEDENDHLQDSVEADRRTEQWLRHVNTRGGRG